jgi:lysylphosphatidylglycerol synthetase-like protein (DUF2156 family)
MRIWVPLCYSEAVPGSWQFLAEWIYIMMNIQEKIVDTSLMASLSHPEMELIRAYGGNSLAFFGLFPQNLHFLTLDGVVNYRLANKVAVVLGDPVCAPEASEKVIESFLDFCAHSHWRVAFYQTSFAYLSAYHALGLHSFKMGEEAVLNPQTFTLHGSVLANVRTSARRAERDGVSIQWFEGVPPTTVMQQLENVSLTWLERKAGKQSSETGFSTGRLDDVIAGATLAENIASLSPSAFPGNAPRFVTAVVTTRAGIACAFVTFTPIYAAPLGEGTCLEARGWGWSLDLMRRTPDAPPGVMELLLARALEHFRSSGAQVVNLGLVALADTCQEMTPGQRYLISGIFDRLHLLEGRESLFKFKQKFHPSWQSRYLVTSSTLALPQIALAILRLRNYRGGGVTRLMSGPAKREE